MQTEEAVKRVDSGKLQAGGDRADDQRAGTQRRSETSRPSADRRRHRQQQVGIEQVTLSIHNIRESSEQIAAGSREVGSAATNLAALSEQLVRVVDRYRV